MQHEEQQCEAGAPGWQYYPSLAAMADTAGYPRVLVPFSRTGAMVLAANPDRLSVVLDAGRAAFVGPAGLVRLPITACTIAWRVG